MPGPIIPSTVTNFTDLQNSPVTKIESFNGEAWDELEIFDHPNQSIAVTGTIAMQPGPGTLTVRDGNATTVGRLAISNHVAQLISGSSSVANAVAITGGTVTQLGLVGKAFVTIIHFDTATVDDANITTDIMLGYERTADASLYQQAQIGFRIGYIEGGGHASNIYATDNGTNYLLFRHAIRANDVLGFKVERSASGIWILYAQGGFFEQFGCYVGSGDWFPCYQSSTSLAGNLLPIVVSRYGATTRILSFGTQTSSTNNASTTDRLLDFSTATAKLDMHIPSVLRNSDGSMWITWQRGTGDTAADVEILSSYIDSSGVISSTVSLGTSVSGNRLNNGSVNLINGQAWAVYQRSSDSYVANSVLHYRVLTQSGGVISAAAEQNFTAVSGSFSAYLNNPNHSLTLPGGRILLPFYTSDANHWGMLYSDDSGSTWTESAHVTAGNEVSPVLEPNGTLAVYIRNDDSSTIFLQRSTSSDSGATWSAAANTAIGCPSARFSASKNPDGTVLLLGNENYTSVTTSNRPCVTGYIVGNGGTVLNKIPLASYAPSPYNLQRLNYPDGFINGNQITYLWAHNSFTGALFFVTRNLSDLFSSASKSRFILQRAIGGYSYAASGINIDITKLGGLNYLDSSGATKAQIFDPSFGDGFGLGIGPNGAFINGFGQTFQIIGGAHEFSGPGFLATDHVTTPKLTIPTAVNGKSGTFTLVSGTKTVANTSVTANSVIIPTLKTASGTRAGVPDCVPTAGVGFTATGAATDNGTYNFVVIEVN